MKSKIIYYVAVILLFNVNLNTSFAQISEEGQPPSFIQTLPADVPTKKMEPVDVEKLKREDQENASKPNPKPQRFGFAHNVNLNLLNSGEWNDVEGGRVWRLRIISTGAYTINLIFDSFHMPDGGEFYLYNDDKSQVLGAFTNKNNKSYGKFSTSPVSGSAVILEYFEPASVKYEGQINISKVVHAYRNYFGKKQTKNKGSNNDNARTQDFGDSASCNVNINCSEGNNWQDEKRAVTMVLLQDNTRICSGAVINNEREDNTPYYLSAFHCADEDGSGNLSNAEQDEAESWIFMFNYESYNCDNNDGPTNQTVSGATFRAGHEDSDFLLLELSSLPPASYDHYFAGWTRSTTAASSSVGIHHPRGDIKKIAIEDNTATDHTWPGTPQDSHWGVVFDTGTVEPVSSGSPLFDQNSRIVGQLHGGTSGDRCTNTDGAYGKFSMSWNNGNSAATRLADWLDPDNTGINALNGKENPYPSAPTNVEITNAGQGGPVYIDWDDNTESDFSYYEVYREQRRNSDGLILGTTLVGTPTSSDYEDSSVSQDDNTTYSFRYFVTAVDNDDYTSAESNKTVWVDGETFHKLASDTNPQTFSLNQNYPNPFNPSTQISFSLPKEVHVNLTVFDVLGRKVQTLLNEPLQAGKYSVTFNAEDVSSGFYMYKIRTPEFTQSRSMTIIK